MLRRKILPPSIGAIILKIYAVSLFEEVTEGRALHEGESFKCLSKYVLY